MNNPQDNLKETLRHFMLEALKLKQPDAALNPHVCGADVYGGRCLFCGKKQS
jgi:hypothetical protein